MNLRKKSALQLLSLALTCLMLFSTANVSTAALPIGSYGDGISSSLTSAYTYEDFTADFEKATYTAFEDFEDVPGGYTAVDAYTGNENGKNTIYPYEMTVSGVENGSFSLKLNNTGTDKLLFAFTEGNANIGNLSSGSYAVLAGYKSSSANIAFVGGDTDTDGNVYNVMKVNGKAQADYKISAIGFALKYGSARKAMNLVVTYDDGSTETVTTTEPAGSTRDKSHFCGVKAPEEKYITGLTIKTPENNASFIVDDLGIIFEEVESGEPDTGEPDTETPVPTGIKIEGPGKVYTPLDGAPEGSRYTYRAYLVDESGSEVESDIPVSLTLSSGNSYVEFNEETGELTVLGAGAANSTLILAAEAEGFATAWLEVTVSEAALPAGAYTNTDSANSMLTYTLDDFKADFEAAEYTAYEDFEEYTESTDNVVITSDQNNTTGGASSIYPFTAKVRGVDNASFSLKINDTAGLTYLFKQPAIGEGGSLPPSAFSSGSHAIFSNHRNSTQEKTVEFLAGDGNNQYNTLIVDGKARSEYKISAVGFVFQAVSMRKEMEFTVTYLDGTYDSVTMTPPSPARTNRFVGFKAPDGKYIASVKLSFTNGFASITIDDFGVIFERIEPVASGLKISGPTTVDTPLYGKSGGNKYNFRAYMIDQFGGEMESDIPVFLTLSNGNDYVEFNEETGELNVLGAGAANNNLIFVAEAQGMDPVQLEVSVNNATYYDANKISSTKFALKVGEKTAERDENDDTGDGLLSREEFVGLLDTAIATEGQDIVVMNFDGEDYQTTTNGEVKSPLYKSGNTFTLATAARQLEIRELDENFNEKSNGSPSRVRPSSGLAYYYLWNEASGGNEFLLQTHELGEYRVTAMGLVMLPHNAHTVDKGFRIRATYSNGKQGWFSANIGTAADEEGKIQNNVFFGIKAPAGHYITNVQIVTSNVEDSIYGKVDEFGFVFETPDIVVLDADTASLKFSDISDEDMNHITKDLKLGELQTVGRSPVEWSTSPAGIIAQDGTLTPPETPDENGETPIVNLKATFKGRVINKDRIFELFVPSKLERDRDAISVPSEASDDITLPTTGSLFGSTITWSAEAGSPIVTSGENIGKVTRPQNKDEYVLLTATISSPYGSIKKNFGVVVKARSSSGSGGGTGGGGGGGGGSIAAPTVIPPQKTPVEVKPAEDTSLRDSVFTDLSTNHWAYESIKELYEKGIVNGTGANTFNPEGNVTREQYLAMLVRAFEFESEAADVSFTDVLEDAWYYDIILTAQKLGISNGYADGSFGIGKNISREEMAVMAYRAAKAAGVALKEEGVDPVWNDSAEISEFAADAVSLLNKNGIIKGMSESEFSPKTTSTRAQAAVIISRLLEVKTVE